MDKIKENRAIRFAPISGNELRKLPLYQLYVYFSKEAYQNMINGNTYTENKELLIIPGAVHTDLYDGGGKNAIPFDKIENFFHEYLN